MRKFLSFFYRYSLLVPIILGAYAFRAYGDYAATQGSGTTIIAFDGTHSGTSRCAAANAQCPGMTLQNSAGTEVGNATTPLQVSLANTGANGTAIAATVAQATAANLNATVVQGTAANLNATVAQGGTWTVNPGNTANTTPWLIKIGDGTNGPVAVKPASTAAGVGDAAAVVTMSPNTVTVPISGTVQPGNTANTTPWLMTINQGGTSATVGTYGTAPGAVGALNVNSFVTNALAPGPATMANSGPVVLASNQVCTKTATISMSTATTTQIVAASGSTDIQICDTEISANGATNLHLTKGTGTNCGTGTGQVGQSWYASAAGWAKAAPNNFYRGLDTGSSQALCVTSSAAVTVDITVYYNQL